ncbi:MAG TPA: hypothetical protein VIX20_05065 [Ktedonobacteraceae bacterium]
MVHVNAIRIADKDELHSHFFSSQYIILSRQWVIWHVIEHDLHHGGELSFSLGAHNLAAPDL